MIPRSPHGKVGGLAFCRMSFGARGQRQSEGGCSESVDGGWRENIDIHLGTPVFEAQLPQSPTSLSSSGIYNELRLELCTF